MFEEEEAAAHPLSILLGRRAHFTKQTRIIKTGPGRVRSAGSLNRDQVRHGEGHRCLAPSCPTSFYSLTYRPGVMHAFMPSLRGMPNSNRCFECMGSRYRQEWEKEKGRT